MSSRLFLIPTWASSVSFKLKLFKMELVTRIKDSFFKIHSCFPTLVRGSPTQWSMPENWSPPDPTLLPSPQTPNLPQDLWVLSLSGDGFSSCHVHSTGIQAQRWRRGLRKTSSITCLLTQVLGGHKCHGHKGGLHRRTSWVQAPALHLPVRS